MNPANYREALVETHEDESEGADILLVCSPLPLPRFSLFLILEHVYLNTEAGTLVFNLLKWQVKPGLPYLDIIRLLRDNSSLPIAAYQVCSLALVHPILITYVLISYSQSWPNLVHFLIFIKLQDEITLESLLHFL